MMSNFSDDHNKAVGDEPAAAGWPDDGNGRYSKRLSYPDWYFMNIARRQRFSGHDAMVTMAPLSLLNGLFMPYPTMAIVSAFMWGRLQYVQGYEEKEGAASF